MPVRVGGSDMWRWRSLFEKVLVERGYCGGEDWLAGNYYPALGDAQYARNPTPLILATAYEYQQLHVGS